jgi:predicted Zn-dependent peptidase
MHRPVLRVEDEPLRKELENGSVLLSQPVAEAYGVAVGVFVTTGTRDEPPECAGISHMLEHLVFKGTPDRNAFELARDLEAMGAQVDAYTTKEHTGYTLQVLPEHLEEALSILASMLEDSVFPEDQLRLEKDVILEEIQSAEDNPEDYVHDQFCEKLWPDHVLRHPVLGTAASVRSIERATLEEWSNTVHRGGNVILAAAGVIGPREQQILEDAFRFAPGTPAQGAGGVARVAPGLHTITREGLSQQYLEIGVPVVDANHPDRFGMALLSNILGGGMSSRLFQRVREEEGLAYSIYTYSDHFRDTGVLGTSFSASGSKCQRAIDLVVEEYRRLRSGEIDDDEVELNKAQIISGVVLGLEGSFKQMLRIGRSDEEVLESIESITREDIVRLADLYLDPARQTVMSYGPLGAEGLSWPG